ncbi:MAG TPA: zf-HC2 domain-containing protein [Acidobacteriota bacterium]|nr:zf-HC2 domain-containing protein [Acidobacteriota bacterium]
MKCTNAQAWLYCKLDGELSDPENAELDEHLARCEVCRREFSLIFLPGKIAAAVSPVKSSPFFYRKLWSRIEDENMKAASWHVLWGMSRKLIPTMAGITLLLLSVFMYLRMNSPEVEWHQVYEGIYQINGQSHRILAAEQHDITYESVMTAIAERPSFNRH